MNGVDIVQLAVNAYVIRFALRTWIWYQAAAPYLLPAILLQLALLRIAYPKLRAWRKRRKAQS